MRRFLLWSPLLAYMSLIYFVSAQSDPLPALSGIVWDKAIHAVEYGVLAGLWCRALRGEGWEWAAAAVTALFATVAYGASDEWHQASVVMRTSDVHDWFADAVGAAAGLVAYRAAALVRGIVNTA
jgi:VanZ family protein